MTVFGHWKKVHSEKLDRHTKLIVELADGEYSASLQGGAWSAGTGRWFDNLADAIQDGKTLYAERQQREQTDV